jgi:hypothetical protein
MKRIYSPLTFVAIILVLLGSCYYDSEEALYPSLNSACDTTNVTFSGKIIPLLANNCLSCHSNATAAGSGNGIRLENYADVQTRSTAIAGSIKQTGTYSAMPKNGGKLKACLITQFDLWVSKGMLNN